MNQTVESFSEVDGYSQGSQSLFNAKPDSTQYGVCTLWFYVYLLVEDDNSIRTDLYYSFNSGWRNVSAPYQVGINSPENEPVPANGSMDGYCGWDFNGSNTRYQAQLARPDESIVNTTGEQSSNHFVISIGSSVVDNGQCKWRARAINDQGIGVWSDWYTFSVQVPLTGYVGSYVQDDPTSPIHEVIATFNYTSGHTITDYSWRLYKMQAGIGWVQVGAETISNPIWRESDDPAGIDYKVVVNVTGTKYNITYQFQAESYGYYREIILPPGQFV